MAEQFMLRALEISRKALPDCLPNPPVGCVMVRDGEIIAQGYTQEIGGNHAEVEALASYRGTMNGVTADVTLEPCSFVGRTPACSRTLADACVKNVVVAMLERIGITTYLSGASQQYRQRLVADGLLSGLVGHTSSESRIVNIRTCSRVHGNPVADLADVEKRVCINPLEVALQLQHVTYSWGQLSASRQTTAASCCKV